MEIKRWLVRCSRCKNEDETVNMRSVSAGTKTYMLCKDCSKEYDQLMSSIGLVGHYVTDRNYAKQT